MNDRNDNWPTRAAEIGRRAYGVIFDMIEALEAAELADDNEADEAAREAIQADPLSIEVRSDWHAPGSEPDDTPTEYRILLSWGGPAVRIIGTLDRWCEPDSATLQVQDWFQPWTDVVEADDSVLLRYASHFFYGV